MSNNTSLPPRHGGYRAVESKTPASNSARSAAPRPPSGKGGGSNSPATKDRDGVRAR